MFAKIKNGSVVEWPIASLAQRFPNTSFPAPITPADVPPGYVMVRTSAPPVHGAGQKAVPAKPVFVDGEWVQGWSVVDLSPQEVADRAAARAAEVDALRAEAYRNESDPLFFKAQRGEATMDEWLASVAAIKARFPG